MRSIWLTFGVLLAILLGFAYFQHRPVVGLAASPADSPSSVVLVSAQRASPAAPSLGQRDSLVRFALHQLGTPYVWAGTSPATGFDCSGFITYVFGHFGVATPHATALLIDAGQPVPRAQARPGDIVVFTGTAEGATTPGHAGIIISALGETPLRFVHASSARRESGVKISEVENSGYEQRFMQVRRVLGGNPASAEAAGASRSPAPLRPAGPVAALPAVSAPIPVPAAVPLPARVAPLSLRPKRHTPRPAAKAVPHKQLALAPRKALKSKLIHKQPARPKSKRK